MKSAKKTEDTGPRREAEGRCRINIKWHNIMRTLLAATEPDRNGISTEIEIGNKMNRDLDKSPDFRTLLSQCYGIVSDGFESCD